MVLVSCRSSHGAIVMHSPRICFLIVTLFVALVAASMDAAEPRKIVTVAGTESERSKTSPQALLGKRMMAAAFDWHNYGKTTIGNRSDIERVPIDNLQDFYRRYYQPDNVVVIVAGKFDDAKALKFA